MALLAERIPRPVRVRGVVVEEPRRLPAAVEAQPLRSQPRKFSCEIVDGKIKEIRDYHKFVSATESTGAGEALS